MTCVKSTISSVMTCENQYFYPRLTAMPPIVALQQYFN
jgi:hypothetical protein